MEVVVHAATSMINVEQALQRIRCSPEEATATGFIRFPVPGTAIYFDQKSPSTSTAGELNCGFPKHGCSTGWCNLFRCLQMSHEQNTLVNWLRKRGFNPTWFTGDYFLAHSRETYQPTTIMRWDRVFLMAQICCVFLLFDRFSLACAAVESLTSTFVLFPTRQTCAHAQGQR